MGSKLNNSWFSGFLAIGIIYFILLIYGSFNNPYLGHADRSNAANVAKNLVNGYGYVTNYVHDFYEEEKLPVKEKTWPILQPTWIALSFKIFGINETAARLPNIIFIILIGSASFFIGKLLSNNYQVAFYCGVSVLLCGRYDIQTRNDTGAILFITMIFLSVLLYEKYRKMFWVFIAGLFAGLAAMQRFELIIVFPILAIYFFLGNFFKSKRKIKEYVLNISNYRYSICVVISSLLFYSPMIIYNNSVHGSLFVSKNSASRMGDIAKYQINSTKTFEERYKVFYNKKSEQQIINMNTLQKLKFYKKNLTEFKKGVYYLLYKSIGFLATCILFCSLFMNFKIIKHNKSLLMLLFSLILAMLISVSITSTFHPRYLYVFSPILISLSFSTLFERFLTLNKKITVNKFFMILMPLILSISIFWQERKSLVHWVTKSNSTFPDSNKASFELIDWINNNTLINEVVMTREPWQINWHTERTAVMVPYGSLDDFIFICKKYDVNYVILDDTRSNLIKHIEGNNSNEYIPIYSNYKFKIFKVNKV